jgi:site-specific DNA-methyltransferase (adenine-specific)
MSPQPYYQDGLVTLYHGDCREQTAWLEADVLVTDPPYGRDWRQGELKGHHSDNLNRGIAHDRDTTVRDAVLQMWGDRWGDRRAILFGDLMLAPPLRTKLVGAYRKPGDAGIRGAMGGVRRDLEAIYLIGRWPSGIGGRTSLFTTGATQVGGSSGVVARSGGHPHTKPQDVMEELIALTVGVVADPFSGSGSTLLAARNRGRKAIGVEVEERYCETIAKRLSADVLDFGDGAA